MYNKIKKLKGERFAKALRAFRSGILDIPDLDHVLQFAGNDPTPLLPYLVGIMNTKGAPNGDITLLADPFELLDEAGYTAFIADTVEKKDSIKNYFAEGELICTFKDAARQDAYHIIHAIRKDAASLSREAFRDKEARQDSYGTSVVSIQIYKQGEFVKITNRYNHTVADCDRTFDANPDNIIPGLTRALKDYFNVDFTTPAVRLPSGFMLVGRQLFKYHLEANNIYYGDQAWLHNGTIHKVDTAKGDAMFDGFVFDNASRSLKKIDPANEDSFADDFNRYYGGNRGLNVQSGNLILNGITLIGAKGSRIKTINLPALTSMSEHCLEYAISLTDMIVPALTFMAKKSLKYAASLVSFRAPSLLRMDDESLMSASELKVLDTPCLHSMGNHCCQYSGALAHANIPRLASIGNFCFFQLDSLTAFDAPALRTTGNSCFKYINKLGCFHVPSLESMGCDCMGYASERMCVCTAACASGGKENLQGIYVKNHALRLTPA